MTVGTGETSLLMDPPAGPEGPSWSQKLLPGQQDPDMRRERTGTSVGNCPINQATEPPAYPQPLLGTQSQAGPRTCQPLATHLSPALGILILPCSLVRDPQLHLFCPQPVPLRVGPQGLVPVTVFHRIGTH